MQSLNSEIRTYQRGGGGGGGGQFQTFHHSMWSYNQVKITAQNVFVFFAWKLQEVAPELRGCVKVVAILSSWSPIVHYSLCGCNAKLNEWQFYSSPSKWDNASRLGYWWPTMSASAVIQASAVCLQGTLLTDECTGQWWPEKILHRLWSVVLHLQPWYLVVALPRIKVWDMIHSFSCLSSGPQWASMSQSSATDMSHCHNTWVCQITIYKM